MNHHPLTTNVDDDDNESSTLSIKNLAYSELEDNNNNNKAIKKKLHVGQIWLECSFGSDRTWAARTVRETSLSPGSVTASQHTRYTVIRQNWAAPLTAAR
ncbi:hypothetical protein T07_7239 [Trichinella nelsoni]|uniref:Uncharacterized protein n=1 Tax=Trichinella nelsoni TaxID=6336 RepID=A0A0V0SCT5_9BILA|nr:hypothetical protein T07_7239 [Trichinella nelsoni]